VLVARFGRLERITDSHDGVPRLTLVNERGRKIRNYPRLVNIQFPLPAELANHEKRRGRSPSLDQL
jgi:hypothetical protein